MSALESFFATVPGSGLDSFFATVPGLDEELERMRQQRYERELLRQQELEEQQRRRRLQIMSSDIQDVLGGQNIPIEQMYHRAGLQYPPPRRDQAPVTAPTPDIPVEAPVPGPAAVQAPVPEGYQPTAEEIEEQERQRRGYYQRTLQRKAIQDAFDELDRLKNRYADVVTHRTERTIPGDTYISGQTERVFEPRELESKTGRLKSIIAEHGTNLQLA